MRFSLSDALSFLRCPVSGAPLALENDQLVSASGARYPIIDGIADLTPQADTGVRPADYDYIGIVHTCCAALLGPALDGASEVYCF